MRFPRGTVLFGHQPLRDDGTIHLGEHFIVVVSSDKHNSLSNVRVCAVMTHAPERDEPLGAFLAHTCFLNRSPKHPARMIGAIEAWNLTSLVTDQLDQLKEIGSSCPDGLMQFGEIVRNMVFRDSADVRFQPYIDKGEMRAESAKRCVDFDAGDIVEIMEQGSASLHVVLSCRHFHRFVSHPVKNRYTGRWRAIPMDSIVAAELRPIAETQLSAAADRVVWQRSAGTDQPPTSFVLKGQPERLPMGSAQSAKKLGTLLSDELRTKLLLRAERVLGIQS